MKHSKENCPFTPGCYIAGDCSLDEWKTARCGLPKEEKQRLRDENMARLQKQLSRAKFTDDVRAGKHDHLIPSPQGKGQ